MDIEATEEDTEEEVDMGGEEVEVVAADPAKNPAVNWFTFAQIFPNRISYFFNSNLFICNVFSLIELSNKQMGSQKHFELIV